MLFPIFHDDRIRLLQFDVNPGAGINPLKADAREIREWIEAKDPRAIGDWNELGAEEYARAFTAARTAGYGVIEDLYREFQQNIANDGTDIDYSRAVMPILKRKGWLADRSEGEVARRVQLIYDTNLRLARGAGRYSRYMRNAFTFPYLRGVTARDERVRHPPKSKLSDHRAFDNIILPVDHLFWKTYWVPLGFRCRCSIIQMTRSQLMRFKGGVTSPEELAIRVARLGPPVFQAPDSFDGQLAEMVTTANENRFPGLPPVDLARMEQIGRAKWAEELVAEAADELADFVNRVLGQAA